MALFQQLRWQEILIILFIALLLFGAKRLPDIGKSLGRSLREFKTATKGLSDDVREGMEEDEETSATPEPPSRPDEREPSGGRPKDE